MNIINWHQRYVTNHTMILPMITSLLLMGKYLNYSIICTHGWSTIDSIGPCQSKFLTTHKQTVSLRNSMKQLLQRKYQKKCLISSAHATFTYLTWTIKRIQKGPWSTHKEKSFIMGISYTMNYSNICSTSQSISRIPSWVVHGRVIRPI